MAEIEGMRLSVVTPAVETNIEKVGELVKLISGGADLTDTQSQRLVGYLGSLEDMRTQIGVMSQHYENDDHVLCKLTLLLDRIDESLHVYLSSTAGYTHEEKAENEDGSLKKNEEESILRQSASQQQSLAVSTTHVLGVSGLLLPRLFNELMAEESDGDYDDDDSSEWDHPLTENDIAQLESVNLSPAPSTNLAQSFMEENAELNAAELRRSSEASSSSKSKGKGKQKKGACEPTLCKICYDEYTDWGVLCTLTNCEHIYCTECMSGYLKTQITSGGVLDLHCPNLSCSMDVNIIDVYSICDEVTLDKYERFMVLAALRADPDVRWCPMQNCSAPIKGPPKDNSQWLTCGTCQLQVCFACGDERHDPAPCGKEAKQLIASRHSTIREAEDMFEAWHKGKPTDVKPCPKCKAYIEKNQGCNHMTCQACKHQFCWLCLAQYESTHFNSNDYPDCKGKQYWYPPVPVDPELQQRYNWIYFPPNYQYAGVDEGPIRATSGPSQASKIKSAAKKVGVYVGVGVAVATLGIPAAIIGGPIYGVFKLHKRLKAKNRRT